MSEVAADSDPFYASLEAQAARWLGKSRDFGSNCANLSAMIMEHYSKRGTEAVPRPVNWVGFYLSRPWAVQSEGEGKAPSEEAIAAVRKAIGDNVLVVSSFQGLPAVPLVCRTWKLGRVT